MKMIEMDEYLVNEGFNVKRKYESRDRAYIFEIEKDGIGTTAWFEYEGPESQQHFLDQIIGKWENAYESYHHNDTLAETFNTLSEKQKLCVYAMMGHIGTSISCLPKIDEVIFNGPATIVKWSDGTKTVVKCCEGDEFDAEKGLAMAISKKALGDLKEVKKWTKKYEKEQAQIQDILDSFREAMRRLSGR